MKSNRESVHKASKDMFGCKSSPNYVKVDLSKNIVKVSEKRQKPI